MAWKQAWHRLTNQHIIFNLRKLNNVFNVQSLIKCLRQKLLLRVSRSIWPESGKLEIELHIRTLTDLPNVAWEMINLMTRTRPTVGRSVRQSVRSSTDCLSANQISEFYAICSY